MSQDSLTSFTVCVKESNLKIQACLDLKQEALQLLVKHRGELERYIKSHPLFALSLVPLMPDGSTPGIVKEMVEAVSKACVGPMAAVAGAIAEIVGRGLLAYCPEVIVDNGGDIFLHTQRPTRVGIYAGASPLTGQLSMEIIPGDMPWGICTSSGTVGPSLSLGRSDAVVVLSPSCPLSDAAATFIANKVKGEKDIEEAIEEGQKIAGVRGIVAIVGEKIGMWGEVNLC